jgi:hypothetical protein
VQLDVTDPSGRTQGKRVHHPQIPSSRYGAVVQIPIAPERSEAIAVEVCDAELGIYEVNVHEVGSSPYQLEVRARGDADNSQTLALHHIATDGRTRSYRFVFKIEDRQVTASWLDDEGHEQLRIENYEW